MVDVAASFFRGLYVCLPAAFFGFFIVEFGGGFGIEPIHFWTRALICTAGGLSMLFIHPFIYVLVLRFVCGKAAPCGIYFAFDEEVVWSFFLWAVKLPWCAGAFFLQGTLFWNVYRRLMGAEIGSNVLLIKNPISADDGKLCIGDNSVMFHGFELLHTFEDWLYFSERVRIGNDCVVGLGSVVMAGATLDAHSILAPGSAILKSETLINPKKDRLLDESHEVEDPNEARRQKLVGYPVREQELGLRGVVRPSSIGEAAAARRRGSKTLLGGAPQPFRFNWLRVQPKILFGGYIVCTLLYAITASLPDSCGILFVQSPNDPGTAGDDDNNCSHLERFALSILVVAVVLNAGSTLFLFLSGPGPEEERGDENGYTRRLAVFVLSKQFLGFVGTVVYGGGVWGGPLEGPIYCLSLFGAVAFSLLFLVFIGQDAGSMTPAERTVSDCLCNCPLGRACLIQIATLGYLAFSAFNGSGAQDTTLTSYITGSEARGALASTSKPEVTWDGTRQGLSASDRFHRPVPDQFHSRICAVHMHVTL